VFLLGTGLLKMENGFWNVSKSRFRVMMRRPLPWLCTAKVAIKEEPDYPPGVGE